MNSYSRPLLGFSLFSAGILLLAFAASAQDKAKPAPTAPGAHQGKLTEEVYKNIKSLRGKPANELIPTMEFIADSLGVECSFCHDVKAFEKDTKEEKRTAREMIAMQQSINRNNFKGKREVTCATCHHGQMHPPTTPAVPELNAPLPTLIAGHEEMHEHAEHAATAAPALTVDNFLEAAGGQPALAKLTSRTEHGTVSFNSGPAVPFQSYTRSTGQRATTIDLKQGPATSVFNGHSGWSIFPGHHTRPLSAGELEAARVEADLAFPINFKQRYSQFRAAHPEEIQGKPVNVVIATRPGQPPVHLYFDPASKMLTRVLYYIETALGRIPVQVDIVRYANADSVQLPAEWIVTRPTSRTTYKVEISDNHATIDDAKFAAPAEAAATK